MTPAQEHVLRELVPAAVADEYVAAQREYASALSRLRAAKAPVAAAYEAKQRAFHLRLEASRDVRLAGLARMAESWLGGARQAECRRLVGKNQPGDFWSCLWEFRRSQLDFEEMQKDVVEATALALERYRDTISRQERVA